MSCKSTQIEDIRSVLLDNSFGQVTVSSVTTIEDGLVIEATGYTHEELQRVAKSTNKAEKPKPFMHLTNLHKAAIPDLSELLQAVVGQCFDADKPAEVKALLLDRTMAIDQKLLIQHHEDEKKKAEKAQADKAAAQVPTKSGAVAGATK